MANVSDFISKLKGGGARANQFKVTMPFPGYAAAGGETEAMAFLCTATNLPSSELGELAVNFRGRPIYMAGDRTFQTWTTTIINDTMGWNKQVLINWAKRQTMEGNDADAVMRDAADTGTLLHLLIEGHQKGFDVDTKDFTRNQEKAAMIAFGAYLEWLKKSEYTNLASEVSLVNEDMRVGGTIDSIGKLKDELVLIDWKSSKYGPYKEHKLQISAYIYMYEAAQPKAKISK